MVTVPSSQFLRKKSYGRVPGSRFTAHGFRFWILRTVVPAVYILFIGCGEQGSKPAEDSVNSQTTSFAGIPTPISNTGLTIDLIEGYVIDSQIDSNFRVYYFKPVNPTGAEDEAGIYFGANPDTSAPMIEYSKRIFDGEFMGNAVQWTEYTTATYTQREVFIDRGPDDKIHCWCYSHDPVTLEKLFWMIRTIR